MLSVKLIFISFIGMYHSYTIFITPIVESYFNLTAFYNTDTILCYNEKFY